MTDNGKTHFRKAFDSPYLSSADIVEPTALTVSHVRLEKDMTKKTGDLFNTVSYPVIDAANGGSLKGVIDGLNHVLELAVPSKDFEEGGTFIIPGRGRLCDEADLVEYRDMLAIIYDRIADLVKQKKTLTQVKAAKPTMDYDGRWGSDTGPWTTDMFIEAVFNELSRPTTTAAK